MKPAVKWRLLIYGVMLLVALLWVRWQLRVPPAIEIRVVNADMVTVYGAPVALSALGAMVADRRESPKQAVQVIVDAKAPSAVLIPVVDTLSRNGVDDVQVIANP